MIDDKETQGFIFAITKITFLNVWLWSITIGAGLTFGGMIAIIALETVHRLIN